jgi:citrate lyase gamma subunit
VTIECVPVRFEGSDKETGDLLFTVEAFDEYAANVEIKSVVDVTLWAEISKEISKALLAMELKVYD